MAKYIFVAFMEYVGLFVINQQIIGIWRGAKNVRGRRQVPWHYFLMMASVVAMPLTLVTTKHQEVRVTPMLVGGSIALCGLIMSMWAQWVLGPNWVGGIGLAPKHQLVTTGPYRIVRHPIYAGMLVSAIGLGVFGWNIWFALAILGFCGSFALRAPYEEQVLVGKFKKAYPLYQHRTGMLLPRVRRKELGVRLVGMFSCQPP